MNVSGVYKFWLQEEKREWGERERERERERENNHNLFILPLVVPEEPSPEEHQQQMMNLLRSMISNAQQTPPASMVSVSQPTSAHMPTTRPSVGVAPSQSSPAVYGGGGVPAMAPRNDIRQPASNTGVRDYQII